MIQGFCMLILHLYNFEIAVLKFSGIFFCKKAAKKFGYYIIKVLPLSHQKEKADSSIG